MTPRKQLDFFSDLPPMQYISVLWGQPVAAEKMPQQSLASGEGISCGSVWDRPSQDVLGGKEKLQKTVGADSTE